MKGKGKVKEAVKHPLDLQTKHKNYGYGSFSLNYSLKDLKKPDKV
jgi:hypothetical protein